MSSTRRTVSLAAVFIRLSVCCTLLVETSAWLTPESRTFSVVSPTPALAHEAGNFTGAEADIRELVTLLHEDKQQLFRAEELGAEILKETVNDTHAQAYIPSSLLPDLQNAKIQVVEFLTSKRPEERSLAALVDNAPMRRSQSAMLRGGDKDGNERMVKKVNSKLWRMRQYQDRHHKESAKTEHQGKYFKGYLNNEGMADWLKNFTASKCGKIATYYSIGKSHQGNELWVLEMGVNPKKVEAKPYFKYEANMHGNEPLGREMMRHLAEYLCAEWEKSDGDKKAQKMLKGMHVAFLMSMNPDGFAMDSRGNANRVDLNRAFWDPWKDKDKKDHEEKRALEAQAVMKWARKQHFVGGATLHEGENLVNYPWDGHESRSNRAAYFAAPDDGAFIKAALEYSLRVNVFKNNPLHKRGITNGAQWYPVYNGMQDWMYVKTGCMQLTIEMNKQKWPSISQVPDLFEQQRDALIAFPYAFGFDSVRGYIRDGEGNPLEGVVVWDGSFMEVPSSRFGDYYRYLEAGRHKLTASVPGYKNVTKTVRVPEHGGVEVDFTMTKA
mmetsp:Transcript_9515/g.11036  ORF Transcript_9515/g.11036 Transcript_9515/m.11036 type:complete len:553 (+) Transcript_9515:372-2030(+)|eukprot:CAMPEP_0197846074 /NCGR_PEP_ID=MMETSP1438-20131217/2892_1 /TAXON_ID=1461541 /ORGANISM="Pterosperma sp., Strain CCMP1384" /LENGTH=552 /DNA_ID=CAMNT_0043457593 /DNA_START=367 /DNA_END=2025 /DNA_ORIENTATION=+